jgi:hypothetical protein
MSRNDGRGRLRRTLVKNMPYCLFMEATHIEGQSAWGRATAYIYEETYA